MNVANFEAWRNEDGLENALRCAMLTEFRRIVADSARHSSIFFIRIRVDG